MTTTTTYNPGEIHEEHGMFLKRHRVWNIFVNQYNGSFIAVPIDEDNEALQPIGRHSLGELMQEADQAEREAAHIFRRPIGRRVTILRRLHDGTWERKIAKLHAVNATRGAFRFDDEDGQMDWMYPRRDGYGTRHAEARVFPYIGPKGDEALSDAFTKLDEATKKSEKIRELKKQIQELDQEKDVLEEAAKQIIGSEQEDGWQSHMPEYRLSTKLTEGRRSRGRVSVQDAAQYEDEMRQRYQETMENFARKAGVSIHEAQRYTRA